LLISRHLFRQSVLDKRLLEALIKRLFPRISGSPEMPYPKMSQHIRQAANMVELGMRCDDMVDSPDSPIP
jgi:hypothetical protein